MYPPSIKETHFVAAAQYFTSLREGKLAGSADSWSYAAMALAYRRGQQYTAVLQIYGEMRDRGMPIYKDVHFGVLEACERLELWKEGREVLRYIQVCGLLRYVPLVPQRHNAGFTKGQWGSAPHAGKLFSIVQQQQCHRRQYGWGQHHRGLGFSFGGRPNLAHGCASNMG